MAAFADIPNHADFNERTAYSKSLTYLEHCSALNIYEEPPKTRLTGIVCTIGPVTNSVEQMTALRKAGMNVVRMNFSHGSHEYHASVIENIRASCAETPGAPVAIALDTKGPEIRTGNNLNDADIELVEGAELLVTTDPAFKDGSTAEALYIDYANMTAILEPGKLIYLNDGLISLEVASVEPPHTIRTIIKNNGTISSRRGVNLPNSPVDLPAVSEKDAADLRFGVEMGVDMVFASFIRTPEDVLAVREVLGEDGKGIKIISKIENHQGVQNFDAILKVTDGVMVARGDLGIEIPPEKVFIAQKMMCARCNRAGKPVICATQMLESMTTNPRPTRAEASDVANAVLDGADCVMLSGETAKGRYPIAAVETMHKICLEAEASVFHSNLFAELRRTAVSAGDFMNDMVASSACNAVLANKKVAAIIVLTRSGASARLVSKFRPPVPIIAVTRNAHVSRLMHLYRGVLPLLYEPEHLDDFQFDVDLRIQWCIEQAKLRGIVKDGQLVIAIQGWKGGPGSTNTLRVIAHDFTAEGNTTGASAPE